MEQQGLTYVNTMLILSSGSISGKMHLNVLNKDLDSLI